MSPEDLGTEEEQEEALEEAGEEISKDERRRSVALWFGVLGSPIAWVGHLGVNYSLEEWFACSESAHEQGKILGVGVKTVTLVFNSAMLVLAALAGLAAYTCWKKLKAEGGDEDDATKERARWMAFAGIVEASLFAGIIVLGYLPSLTLDVCETSP
jgi:hypothetical protein